jgi:GAF domain-containing protein
MISTERLLAVFVEVADTLVDDFDIIDFLHSLTLHVADVSGAEAVGLMLADEHQELQFMAASNAQGRLLEQFQLASAEGPCLDCFTTRRPVVNADLPEASDRWPLFGPAASDAGFRSVHAFPMRYHEETIGALNLFSRTSGDFSEDEVKIVQALTDVATIALIQERSIARADELTVQLHGALNSRILLEQAKGALAQRAGISPDEAFVMMRTTARSNRRKLIDVAQEIVGTSPDHGPSS